MKRHRLLAPLTLLCLSACVSPPDTGGETVLERRDSYAFAFIPPGSAPTHEPVGNRITLIRYENGDYWMTSTLHTTRRCRMRVDPGLGQRVAAAWRRAAPMFAQINDRYASLDYEVVLQPRGAQIEDRTEDRRVSSPPDAVERHLTDLTDALDAYCRDVPQGNPIRLDASLRALEQN